MFAVVCSEFVVAFCVITFRIRHSQAKCIVPRPSVCLCVCLSFAAFPHCCTAADVTLANGRGCPLVVHRWADLQSVHGFRCYIYAPDAKYQRGRMYSLCGWLSRYNIDSDLCIYALPNTTRECVSVGFISATNLLPFCRRFCWCFMLLMTPMQSCWSLVDAHVLSVYVKYECCVPLPLFLYINLYSPTCGSKKMKQQKHAM